MPALKLLRLKRVDENENEHISMTFRDFVVELSIVIVDYLCVFDIFN